MEDDFVARAAAKLTELRLERGISRRQLADEAGVPPSEVTRVEGGRDARLSTWAKLVAALGYEVRLEFVETCEEAGDLLAEEADRRRERRLAGLCTGKRRFW